jgi:hypothetical protein
MKFSIIVLFKGCIQKLEVHAESLESALYGLLGIGVTEVRSIKEL